MAAHAKRYWLITNVGNEESPWVIRAPHGTLAEAQAQAEQDLYHGRQVLRVEHGTDKQQQAGEAAVVWEPPRA